MDQLLTNFWRILIICLTFYLIYFLNKDAISNHKLFIKRYLSSLCLAIGASIIILLGIEFTNFLYHVLDNNFNAGKIYLISLIALSYLVYIDSLLTVIIPATLIILYGYYSKNFLQSFIRSSCSSIIVFLISDIIYIMLQGKPSPSLNRILFSLLSDIIGGLLFGIVVSFILLIFKRYLIGVEYDKNVILKKYYKLLFSISLIAIVVYFIFFFKISSNFSLVLKNYDVFTFQFNKIGKEDSVRVVIPTSLTLLAYNNHSPFMFDWNYLNYKLSSKKSCSLVGKFNLSKYEYLFKDKLLFYEMLQDLTLDDLNELFDPLFIEKISPGKITITGNDTYGIWVVDHKSKHKFNIEMLLPCNENIYIGRDMRELIKIGNKMKTLYKYFEIEDSKNLLSFIGTEQFGNTDFIIKNIRGPILWIGGPKKNKYKKKQYNIMLTNNGQIKSIPKDKTNHMFINIGNNNDPEKEIVFHKLFNGCLIKIDANNLIYEIFKDHKIKNIFLMNFKGKLSYGEKEVNFVKDNLLLIVGENIVINQFAESYLYITGKFSKISVNNKEISNTVISSFGETWQKLTALIMLIVTVLTYFGLKPRKRSKRKK